MQRDPRAAAAQQRAAARRQWSVRLDNIDGTYQHLVVDAEQLHDALDRAVLASGWHPSELRHVDATRGGSSE